MYECEKCGKCFHHISKLQRHNEISSNCNTDKAIPEEKYSCDEFKCDICKKTFSKLSNYKRHQENNGKCGIVLAVKEEMKDILKTANFGTTINNHNYNHISNIVNEIMLARPGKERFDHITKDVMLEILKHPSFKIISLNLVKLFYFNKKVPENSNWTIAYPANKKAAVIYNYDTCDFVRRDTKEIINLKFQNMIDLLQPLIEEIYKEDEEKNNLSAIQKRNLTLYYSHFGVDNLYEEAPDIYQAIHELSYEYRSIPMTYWKKLGYTGKHLSIKF